MALLLVFLCFFIWSTSFTLGKTTLDVSSPIFLTGFRMIMAGVILLGFLFFVKRDEFKITKRQILPLLLLSLMAVYLTNALEFWSLQYLTAGKTCFLYSLSPFVAALLSYLQFKEKMTKRKWLGLMIGFVGFLPVLMYTSGGEGLLGGMLFLSWAEIAMIGAVITSVYGWILLRKLGKDEGMSPLMANGASMLLGGLFAMVHSFFLEEWNPVPVTAWGGFLQGVFLMILVSNLICYNLYGWLLKRFTATFLSFAGLTTPIFAAFFGWVALGESVAWSFFLSMGIISLGLWLVYGEELRLGYMVQRISSSEKEPVE